MAEFEQPKQQRVGGASRNFLARIVGAAEQDAETAAQFDGQASAEHRKSTEGKPKPVVTPLTPGEEALWKEYGACYRRLNNKRG
mmetsp:Transcript_28816/g.73491  ORF Transcript_28816/g.73491 Transcript_28816/m.73491 type:complete len:84 (+) Transcript_28816:151-402(+)|eukprot:CAMPEP_0202863038 /NCGR_PEP_ID=MMETSP1391-20130828/3841_1 /ASSEMBLY_ACC=CAM_ASM_000867 /TAXON_ID=1034604 /ORGANISM="Chlamydomonas leiostraca, Strain SAG 11-49" /LENGTH=83 /DNA_ID=CAMNT_0049542633 /DNA_START=129 /DNA_END=380 /DNA_ORIENTATION=+